MDTSSDPLGLIKSLELLTNFPKYPTTLGEMTNRLGSNSNIILKRPIHSNKANDYSKQILRESNAENEQQNQHHIVFQQTISIYVLNTLN